jgi:phage-related minor tail protein
VFQIDLGAHPNITAVQAFNIPFAANYAAGLLSWNQSYLGAKFPTFTPSQILQGTAAGYNFDPVRNIRGDPNAIDRGTTQGNYGSNVMGLMSCFQTQ